MLPLAGLLDIGGKLIDKLIPDPEAKAKAQAELLKMQNEGELAKMANDTKLYETEQNNLTDRLKADMFRAADKLRGNMEPSDYKHVALELIFLKYISDAFEAKHASLLAADPPNPEDKDEYLADNVFWVPKEARWWHPPPTRPAKSGRKSASFRRSGQPW